MTCIVYNWVLWEEKTNEGSLSHLSLITPIFSGFYWMLNFALSNPGVPHTFLLLNDILLEIIKVSVYSNTWKIAIYWNWKTLFCYLLFRIHNQNFNGTNLIKTITCSLESYRNIIWYISHDWQDTENTRWITPSWSIIK